MSFLRSVAKFWFFLSLVVFGVYVGVHNKDLIQISLPPLLPAVTMPSFAALSLSFLAGGFVATLWFVQDAIASKLKMRKMQKKLRSLEDLNPTQPVETFFGAHRRSDPTIND